MIVALILIALVILGAAAAAMLSRNLIHSALLLVGAWAGIAAFYLWAGAEFVAFAQALIYVGAVSMVVNECARNAQVDCIHGAVDADAI